MASGSYFDLGTVKSYCDIKQNDGTDDELLRSFGEAGNRYLDDELTSESAVLPLTDDKLVSAKNIVNYHATVLYKAKRKDKEGVEIWTKMRDTALASLKKKLMTPANASKSNPRYSTFV